jgi:four helix bundle protein
MQDYRKLTVWQKAHVVALGIHRVTEAIPRRGNSELINQIRRAALSIPANIAEGCARATDLEFAKFLQTAVGSSSELEYHLHFAADADLLRKEDFAARQAEIVEVRRMLIGLIKRLLGAHSAAPLSR